MTTEITTEMRIKALANFLECEIEDIAEKSWQRNEFGYGKDDYFVLTDSEADELAKTYIRDSLWAFNASFILNHSRAGWSCVVEKALKKMQEELCESGNELVFALIDDFNKFVEDAISEDGRGPFISRYDGYEDEERIEGEWLYIYRV